mmetsp:Transcript_15235/g.47163  ORF Transcript_15235/g.47163 Transcript_15235/m.47163 type:complete len:290 (-) Transcript_15235:95-964(-)
MCLPTTASASSGVANVTKPCVLPCGADACFAAGHASRSCFHVVPGARPATKTERRSHAERRSVGTLSAGTGRFWPGLRSARTSRACKLGPRDVAPPTTYETAAPFATPCSRSIRPSRWRFSSRVVAPSGRTKPYWLSIPCFVQSTTPTRRFAAEISDAASASSRPSSTASPAESIRADSRSISCSSTAATRRSRPRLRRTPGSAAAAMASSFDVSSGSIGIVRSFRRNSRRREARSERSTADPFFSHGWLDRARRCGSGWARCAGPVSIAAQWPQRRRQPKYLASSARF